MLRKLPANARRRLSDDHLIQITSDLLVQPMDVDLGLPEDAQVPVKSIPGWFTYGAASALERMKEAHRLGVQEFVLRISDSTPGLPVSSRLDRHSSTTAQLVSGAPDGMRCTVDPFALALNPDGSWGIRDGSSGIDAAATYSLVQDVAAAVASCGVHGIVTLGRLPKEVQYTREGIKSAGGTTRIYSFSQNSETSTAYVYLSPDHRDTGQKILPGNLPEMTLWALMDVFQGTEVSVTKPLENFHATLDLVHYASHVELMDELFGSSAVRSMHPFSGDVAELFAGLQADRDTLAKRLNNLEFYGYTVSGSTRALAHLAAADGVALARARLEESWMNWLAAAGRPGSKIIDRNVVSYLSGGLLF